MPFTLARQQFYDVLWSAPMKQLRPAFGVSDVMIGRVARGANIPVPGLGYWRKVEAGAPTEQLPLPPADILAAPLLHFHGTLTPEIRQMFTGEPGVSGPEEDLEVLSARLRDRLGVVAIPKHDKDFHPAIRKMQLRDLRRDRWGGPRYTSPAGLRALRLANAMMLAVEKIGARPGTSVDYDDFKFDLGLKWGVELKVHLAADDKLSIGPADQWRNSGLGNQTFHDTEANPLEGRLAEIIQSYAVNGERAWREWRDQNAEYERKEALRKAEERERQEREAEQAAREKAEQERLARIAGAVAEAHSWRDAELLRQYASAYRLRHGGDGSAAEHCAWLLSVADQIDPLGSEKEAG